MTPAPNQRDKFDFCLFVSFCSWTIIVICCCGALSYLQNFLCNSLWLSLSPADIHSFNTILLSPWPSNDFIHLLPSTQNKQREKKPKIFSLGSNSGKKCIWFKATLGSFIARCNCTPFYRHLIEHGLVERRSVGSNNTWSIRYEYLIVCLLNDCRLYKHKLFEKKNCTL